MSRLVDLEGLLDVARIVRIRGLSQSPDLGDADKRMMQRLEHAVDVVEGRVHWLPIASFFVPVRVHSLNDRIVNAGATRRAYKQARATWAWHLRAARLGHKIPIADGERKRRVTLLRLFTGREREWDADNFIGGAKVLVDSMVAECLIADDSAAFVEIEYRQSRDPQHSGVKITIQEMH